VFDIPRLPAVKAVAVRADPHCAVGCLSDGCSRVIREARYAPEVLPPKDLDATGFGAYPEIAFPVLKYGQNTVGAECRLELWMGAVSS